MSATAAIPPGWSPSRFWLVAAVVFAGQVGWIFLLGQRSHGRAAETPRRDIVRMVPTPMDEETWSKYVFAVDPTVIPTSGSHGFADLAWHQLPANEYSAPLPKPQPVFLEFASIPSPAVAQAKGFPLLLLPSQSASQSPEPVLAPGGRAESTFRIEGALTARQIAPPTRLRAWTDNYLLTNTVIDFAVNRAGQVFTEALLEGSGLDDADQAALAAVRDFRFRPASKSSPAAAWDTAIFYWRTIPPSTNSVK